MQSITKIDGVRRQLDFAIRCWLAEDDLAPIQTLAWAALTVLRDLAKAAGLQPGVRPQLGFDREAACFLKHADRDPEAWILEIDPVIPELAFHEAISLFGDLGHKLTHPMEVARPLRVLLRRCCTQRPRAKGPISKGRATLSAGKPVG